MEWISTRDHLPDDGDRCIVYSCCKFKGGIYTAEYDYCLGFEGDSVYYDNTIDDVTHWMPLPQPPEDA